MPFLAGKTVGISLGRNAVYSAVQSIIVTICYFLLLKITIAAIGLEEFGVWALLVSLVSIVRVGDISGGGVLARFVAVNTRDGDSAETTVETVVLTSLVINGLIAGSVLVILPHFVGGLTGSDHATLALSLVPWLAGFLFFSGMAMAIISGIDGLQRADIRAKTGIVINIASVAAGYFVIPQFGVLGFAGVLIGQQVATLVIGWMVLRNFIPKLAAFPYQWRRDKFLQTTSFTLKLTATNIAIVPFDPLIKLGLNHAGGPALVGLFEVASRVVLQLRAIVLAAATPLMPAFAAQKNIDSETFTSLLKRSSRIAAIASAAIFFGSVALTPVSGWLVLEDVSPDFIYMGILIALGWSINTVVIPIYLASKAQGILRWNFLGHFAICAVMAAGTFFVGPYLGLYGLLVAMVLALVTGSLIIYYGNHYAMKKVPPSGGETILADFD